MERKPSVSLKELMMTVALGARDEDTLTSLANRVIRLNSQMSSGERKEFAQVVGVPASQLAEDLLDAFDEDMLRKRNDSLWDYIENERRLSAHSFNHPGIGWIIASIFLNLLTAGRKARC